MIGIVSYGTNNITSLVRSLVEVNADFELINDNKSLKKFDRFIFPGVGSFDYCVTELKNKPWFDELSMRINEDHIPILGICIGFHLFFSQSAEGEREGLGWIDGKVDKLKGADTNVKVPHVGWSKIKEKNPNDLTRGLDNNEFYFIHSYAPVVEDPKLVLATCNHGHEISVAVQKQNIFGVQFHPEKSYVAGLKIFKNFMEV